MHQVELCLNKTKDFWLDLLNTDSGYDLKIYRQEFDKGDVTQWDQISLDHSFYGKYVKDYEEFDGDKVCLIPRFEDDYNQAILIIEALSFIYTSLALLPEHFSNDLKSFFMDDLKSYEKDADHMIEIFEAHVREWQENNMEAGF